jgi:enoyl-CoA hydratase/carnithine racemase
VDFETIAYSVEDRVATIAFSRPDQLNAISLRMKDEIVIASDQAQFFDPHVSIGLVSGREVVRLARVLPRTVALRMALMGRQERMSAQRAYELGMVSEVVPHERLMERAREIAALACKNAPLAVRGTRMAILKGLDLPLHEAEILAESYRLRVTRTNDANEGPRAFMEKREPKWTVS